MNADPVHIIPRLVERVWGRTDLTGWFGGSTEGEGAPLGEAWLTSAGCEVEGGGTLGDVIDRDRTAMLGESAAASPAPQPILVKLLFTSAVLSVQVHPTDVAARDGGVAPCGKNEAWHVLEASPDAVVWTGFQAPVTPAQLRAAVADGSVMALLRQRAVRPGDTVSVPAGTVHTIGAGLTLLEVQDPVDVTYRLFDFGRPRPLQIEEAMAVADLGPLPEQDSAPESTLLPGGRVLVRAPRFLAERHGVGAGLTVRPDGGRYHLLVPLAPGILLNGRELRNGTAALVPAQGHAAALSGAGTAPVAILHPGPDASPCLFRSTAG